MLLKQVREMLGSNAVPLQLPIGAEDNFKGVVDLINFRGMVWNEDDKGMTYETIPIPEDMMEEATEWREKLLKQFLNMMIVNGEILRRSIIQSLKEKY
jgi:elongation factor G